MLDGNSVTERTRPVRDAPGGPGIAPTWSSSDKDFVTTALGASRLWATIGHGVVNEVFWPSTGRPRLRDMTFYLVGADGWIDLKRVARYQLSRPAPTLPLLTIVHEGDGYALTLEIVPDPSRDVLLVRYAVTGDYRLVVIAAPHLAGGGEQDSAWVDGELFATGGGESLCLAAADGFESPSVGYVGASDGWQDLSRNGRLTFDWERAADGNVALSAGLPTSEGVLAIGFGETAAGARTLARSSLAESFDLIRTAFLDGWSQWRERSGLGAILHAQPAGADDLESRLTEEALCSVTVLKAHEDRTYPGAMVASLSVPWGSSTDTLGGYHLVWPRDASLTAFALAAVGQIEDAGRILAHLQTAQQADGHWPQNYYPSGEAFWTGIQLDEAALPVLLAAKLRALGAPDSRGLGAMIRSAVGFVCRTGPASQQDRWEENPGINPFTLATAIAALVAAEPWLEGAERAYALDLADDWNARLEDWCYVAGTPLAAAAGARGYYVRIASASAGPLGEDLIVLRNRQGESVSAAELVALDFSYLTRLGLRDPRDPRILDTIRVVDHVLRVPTPSGPVFHRYNSDGYGEHADGAPFDGHGIGRGWPLLVGERGHLALGAGEDCLPYLQTMLNCASVGGLLPEQVWDTDAIPGRGLFPGRPSGSAMPLLWAHAEFVKLYIARRTGEPVERLEAVAARYGGRVTRSRMVRWRTQMPLGTLCPDRPLAVEDTRPFAMHCGWDGWQDVGDRIAEPGPFGLWSVGFAPQDLAPHGCLDFTRRYLAADGSPGAWEDTDHRIGIESEPAAPPKVG